MTPMYMHNVCCFQNACTVYSAISFLVIQNKHYHRITKTPAATYHFNYMLQSRGYV